MDEKTSKIVERVRGCLKAKEEPKPKKEHLEDCFEAVVVENNYNWSMNNIDDRSVSKIMRQFTGRKIVVVIATTDDGEEL